MTELHGEKIDIIDWSDDPADVRRQRAVAGRGALGRGRRRGDRAARVIVPDYQLSLAIGREGQNARLAARLTGWRIDIRSDAEAMPRRRQLAGGAPGAAAAGAPRRGAGRAGRPALRCAGPTTRHRPTTSAPRVAR